VSVPPGTHRVRPSGRLLDVIRAVVFDLDGVLLDSEQLWDAARRTVAADHSGRWHDGATAAMQGMSSVEWSRYLRDELGVRLEPERIVELVVEYVLEQYRLGLPWLPGARDAVLRMAGCWPVALASSANRVVIDAVLAIADLDGVFRTTVSSEEVARGKPEPDVYLQAARRLDETPATCAAVEDSTNGIRSALAAGMQVVAVPSSDHPPPTDVLGRVQLVVTALAELTVEAVARLGDAPADREDARMRLDDRLDDRLDEEELESFPASDPHSDWAGPPD